MGFRRLTAQARARFVFEGARAPLLAAAAGVAIALSGAPRDLFGLGFCGPALLLFALHASGDRSDGGARWSEVASEPRPSPRTAFGLGLIAGATANAGALYWVAELLVTFAGFPPVAAWLTAGLLFVAQGLTFAMAMAAATLVEQLGIPRWLALATALVVASSLTPSLFAWRLAGTQVPFVPWVQMAELGGEPLLDLMVALVGAGLAEGLIRRRALPVGAAVLTLLVPFAYGLVRLPEVRAERSVGARLLIGVVQPNIGIHEKHDRALAFDHLTALRGLSRSLEDAGADLVIWPESAHPFPFARERTTDLPGLHGARFAGQRIAMLFGAVTWGADGQRYNSVVAMDRAGHVVGIRDKIELLAFGEYVPFWDYLPYIKDRFPRGFTAGTDHRPLAIETARIGVLNCYEDVLPAAARAVAREAPTVLVNVTNDAWFGDTAEPHLHAAMARLRSIETRRDLVRAVNTGVSSHVMATGEIAHATATFATDAFVAEARQLETVTPWTRFGDLVTPALIGMWLGCAMAFRRR